MKIEKIFYGISVFWYSLLFLLGLFTLEQTYYAPHILIIGFSIPIFLMRYLEASEYFLTN